MFYIYVICWYLAQHKPMYTYMYMYVHIFRTYAAYVVHILLLLDYTCVPYMYIYVKHMQHRYYTVPKLLLHIM